MQLHPVRHGLVDSTNERALAEIAAGRARHGDLHLAEGQTAGRGRRGRRWLDEPGASVLGSAVLLPPALLPHPEVLTMAAGLGVLACVRAVGVDRAALDWPNDLVVDGAKLAGILVESRGLDARHPHYVVGVGINVTQRAFQAELTEERAVTSCALAGSAATREQVEERLTETLGRELGLALDDPHDCAARFAEAADLTGRWVEVSTAQGAIGGTFSELDLEHGVVLASAAGPRTIPLAHVTALSVTPPSGFP